MPIKDTKISSNILIQIRKIGSNFNQTVRFLNSNSHKIENVSLKKLSKDHMPYFIKNTKIAKIIIISLQTKSLSSRVDGSRGENVASSRKYSKIATGKAIKKIV